MPTLREASMKDADKLQAIAIVLTAIAFVCYLSLFIWILKGQP
jgi:hypothetical protein